MLRRATVDGVSGQVPLVLERPAARGAREDGLLRVAPCMLVQTIRGCKHGRADHASERLSAVLLLHVLDQGHFEAEGAAAGIARERPLARVPAHVRCQVRLVVEPAGTHRARKRTLAGMCAHVPLQTHAVQGHKGAHLAWE